LPETAGSSWSPEPVTTGVSATGSLQTIWPYA
jgi:hypothetical protein